MYFPRVTEPDDLLAEADEERFSTSAFTVRDSRRFGR